MTNGGSDTYACKCPLTTLSLPVTYKNPKITIAFYFQNEHYLSLSAGTTSLIWWLDLRRPSKCTQQCNCEFILVGYDSTSMDNQITTFRRNEVSSSSTVEELWIREYEALRFLDASGYSYSLATKYFRRNEYSVLSSNVRHNSTPITDYTFVYNLFLKS
jgi:hypothetical protein